VTGRRRLGLVAAMATLLAAAPLSAIFESWTWLMQCILTVGLIAGGAVLARSMRFPLWAQALSMAGVLLIMLTWMFPSGEEFLAVLPSTDTFQHFGRLLTEAGEDTRNYGVPVPDRKGLLFVTVLGIGGCAIVVDLLTVGLRKPALAGLPMLAIYSVPVAVYVDNVPVMPFIVGAIGFLWLLVADNVDRVRRFGRRFTGDGRDVDVWEPSPLAAAGRRLAVIGVAAAVLLPLVVPGMTTGLLSRLTQVGTGSGAGGFGAGGNGRVNLFASLSGSLNQEEVKDMIRVTTNEADPYYLRLGVADVVTVDGFTNRNPQGRSINRGGLTDPRQQQVPRGVAYEQFRAEVEILDLNMGLAPIYPTTIAADGLGNGWAYDANAEVLFSTRNTTKDKTYTFDYVRARYNPEALRSSRPVQPEPNSPLFSSTRVPPDPFVDDLVAKLTRDKATEYDKVRAIYDHFTLDNGFSYSLATTSGTSGSDIAAFLQSKVGFCQQYAAAMAWMVRAAGIPARVAFGFTRGADRDGNTWTLTNRNAHAWTEVYFQDFGWVPFDATPAGGVVGSSRSQWAPDNDLPEVTTSASGGSAAPGTDSSAAPGQTAPQNRPFDDGGLAVDPGTGTTPMSTAAMWAVAGAAVAIALLLVPALLRVLRRRRRHVVTAPKTAAVTSDAAPGGTREVTVTMETVRAREDAHAAWDELIDTMIDYRVPVDPTETPRHTAQRLIRDADLQPTSAESATLLGRAEERARYARQPLRGGELTAALGRVRKGLARSASRRTRMMARLMPPSVLLRWRLELADASARWVGIAGRGREVLMRWSPRRLLAQRAR
jgi:transglutaminase-like putative cysteine protease